MKSHSPLFRILLVAAFCLIAPPASAAEAATNSETITVVVPALDELRIQLDAIQNAGRKAEEKSDALLKQNSALEAQLAGMQEALLTQRERERELAAQSQTFNLRVLFGAALALCLIFLLSYWFQIRCFNRVVELTKAMPALPPGSPALLDNGHASSSRLLDALKTLEHRIQQLEAPGEPKLAANGDGGELNFGLVVTGESEENKPPSSAALFMEKGQVLLDLGRLQEALNCFHEAANVEPGNAETHFRSGITLERMNRLEPALAAYEQALRLNPKKTLAYVYKARVLQGLQRFDEAVSVYDSAMGKAAARTEVPVFTN